MLYFCISHMYESHEDTLKAIDEKDNEPLDHCGIWTL